MEGVEWKDPGDEDETWLCLCSEGWEEGVLSSVPEKVYASPRMVELWRP